MRKFLVIKTNPEPLSYRGIPEIQTGDSLVEMLKKYYFHSAKNLTDCKMTNRIHNSEGKNGETINIDVYEEIDNKLILVFPVKSQKEIVYK